jgi:very-short-patch-repair endonuclease
LGIAELRHIREEVVAAIHAGSWPRAASQYRPPYDSPIEENFAYNAAKYLDHDVTMQPQHRIRTYCGNFRVDFLLALNKRRVAVEYDGKAFHRYAKDLAHDTVI